MKNLLIVAAALAALALGCKKKENAGAGTGTATATGAGTATATGAGTATATGGGAATGAGAGSAPAAPVEPPVDVKMFASGFEAVWKAPPGDERAKAACATRPALLELVRNIQKDAPPAGRDAQTWLEDVEALQNLVDEMGAPCKEDGWGPVEDAVIAARGKLDALLGPAGGGPAGGGGGAGAGGGAGSPVAAFAAAFDPVNSKLDHVSRARTACEQRAAWLDALKAIDKSTAGVDALHKAIDEMGDPCDEGNIKAIEAKLDEAKKALDALPK